MADILYIVVPCYNEQEVLLETSGRLKQKVDELIAKNKISAQSKIMFVDDGSRDKTWQIIEQLHEQNSVFSGVKLSRNRGHQNALLAGLYTAAEKCDVTISMDADLQDDIDAVDKFIENYLAGCDVVYGVRSRREKDTAFKRGTAQFYYKFLAFLGVEIVYNHADYRLLSARAVQALKEFKEVNLFLRGLVPLIGFKSAEVEYERGERFAGESKYPLKKMLAFALDGVTSFSTKPLRFITLTGVLILCASVLALIYIFIKKITAHTVQGWATLMGSVWFLGGLQLFAIGIVGEYISKIYTETKARPAFIIDKLLDE